MSFGDLSLGACASLFSLEPISIRSTSRLQARQTTRASVASVEVNADINFRGFQIATSLRAHAFAINCANSIVRVMNLVGHASTPHLLEKHSYLRLLPC